MLTNVSRTRDAELVRQLLASSLDACYDLTVATSFTAALAHAARGECDVILLDLSLPDSLGVESVQELALAAPRTPIVVLTGLDHEYMAMKALRHGAQDYLVKGQIDSLTGLVNRAPNEIAKLLCGVARKGDTVARLGGDEFTLVLEEGACMC